MIKVENEKQTKYKVAWDVPFNEGREMIEPTKLVSLTINTYQLDVLGQILADNNINGFGVTVIK